MGIPGSSILYALNKHGFKMLYALNNHVIEIITWFE